VTSDGSSSLHDLFPEVDPPLPVGCCSTNTFLADSNRVQRMSEHSEVRHPEFRPNNTCSNRPPGQGQPCNRMPQALFGPVPNIPLPARANNSMYWNHDPVGPYNVLDRSAGTRNISWCANKCSDMSKNGGQCDGFSWTPAMGARDGYCVLLTENFFRANVQRLRHDLTLF